MQQKQEYPRIALKLISKKREIEQKSEHNSLEIKEKGF